MLKRIIPSSGETLPLIGLGTWKTFDVSGAAALAPLSEVLDVMQQAGGTLIDSSPMYGLAEETVGELTQNRDDRENFFYATKVWTTGSAEGIRQMNDSFSKMKRERMDLMQIHNLLDWKTHLRTLREWKEEGRIRYIGITHYTNDQHEELEKILRSEPIDFVQFNYSVINRHAEKRLLPAAAELGVATLINRPYGEGRDFARVKDLAVPAWAIEQGINTWSLFFLLYLAAHPAATCIIPATRNPAHAAENFNSTAITLPSDALRQQMAKFVDGL